MTINTRIRFTLVRIRDSYWFIPSLFTIAGLAAGLALVLVDGMIGDAWLGRWEWFYGSRPEGARGMLTTIAGSTITVAGVVFSITLAAVTYASGQFGPRLLSNFVRDRGNQVTLGVFIGTYLYCLVVMRTIRSAEEASADSSSVATEAFVPHLAMTFALVLAVASTAVLIYFVHHVTDGIHINNVIARVGRGLLADIHKIADQREPDPGPYAVEATSFRPINASRSGYIASIDLEKLQELASEHGLVMRQTLRTGEFVTEGHPLIEVTAEGKAELDDALDGDCLEAFSIANRRTGYQDPLFAVHELVEIAGRALSPGVNDPFTAIACIDWLGAALAEMDRSPPPNDTVADEDGQIRLLLNPIRFDDLLFSSFGRLRSYVSTDPNALRHTLNTLSALELNAQAEGHQRSLRQESERLRVASHR